MKVLIALASSSGQLSGVPRHAINLARCLLTRREVSEVHLVAAPWQRDFVQDAAPCGDARLHLDSAPIGKGALSRNLWFYKRLPELAAQLGIDIVHLAYPVPVKRNAFPCVCAVTLHDLYPYDIPGNFGFPKVIFNRAILGQCLQRADAIACVSRSTFSRLESLFPSLAGKARVIYNSVEPVAQPQIETPEWGRHPFLLFVAQHRSNKNIPLALRVFERMLRERRIHPATRLLVVGIEGPETRGIRRFIADAGFAERVPLLSGISDAQLQWCYRNARLLLAPSAIEGFGLPVAEALLAGCRVVCSDIPAFRELGGGHCRYFPLGAGEDQSFFDAVCGALRQPVLEPVALDQISAVIVAERVVELYRSLLLAREESALIRRTRIPSTREGRQSI